MMMAHDSSPGPSGLDDATIETVRAALVKYLSISTPTSPPSSAPTRPRSVGTHPDLRVDDASVNSNTHPNADESRAELRAALRALAAEARAKSVLPESLLVALKDIWYGLPNLSAARAHTEQLHLLQRLVTMCIKEYYAD
jgi:hypothetical protein